MDEIKMFLETQYEYERHTYTNEQMIVVLEEEHPEFSYSDKERLEVLIQTIPRRIVQIKKDHCE